MRKSSILLIIAVAATMVLITLCGTVWADNTILWQEQGIDSGGGGWWFSEHTVEKIEEYQQSGIPGNLVQRMIEQGVPLMKQATIQHDQRQYRWYWYGFRFSRSTAQGIHVTGPGALKLTFTDPEDPSNTYTLHDLGMLISYDNQLNTYRDTASGHAYIVPHKKDPRRMTRVWCLLRLPRRVGGRPLDRVCVLTHVQPVSGKWEVIK